MDSDGVGEHIVVLVRAGLGLDVGGFHIDADFIMCVFGHFLATIGLLRARYRQWAGKARLQFVAIRPIYKTDLEFKDIVK